MGSRHHSSSTQHKVHNPPVTLIDGLSEQFEYLQVSTTSNNNLQDAHLTTTVSSHNNHQNNYGQHNNIQPLLDTNTKRPWSNANEGSTTHTNNHRRHSSNPSPQQQNNIQTSTNGPQPLLQLMPHTPQPAPVSPSNGGMSPGSQQAYFYGSQMAASYFSNAPYYAGPNQRGAPNSAFNYQYPSYMGPHQGQYQWPMTNINFMPNLFVMAGAAGPSHNFAMPPPPSAFQQPMPLMKQNFRHGYQDQNRRFNRPQSESARYSNGSRGNNNGNGQYRRQGSKTALCRNITDLSHCSFGDRCYFAHSADELKPKPANTKYKTVNCTAFTEKGNCPYGDKCHYIHPGEEERPPTDPLRQ